MFTSFAEIEFPRRARVRIADTKPEWLGYIQFV